MLHSIFIFADQASTTLDHVYYRFQRRMVVLGHPRFIGAIIKLWFFDPPTEWSTVHFEALGLWQRDIFIAQNILNLYEDSRPLIMFIKNNRGSGLLLIGALFPGAHHLKKDSRN